jgi:hypothetical protein
MYLKQVAICALVAMTASAVIATRPGPDPKEPAIDPKLKMPAHISAFVNRACADCHTSHTRWPWYGHIPPVSWLLQRDVDKARKSVDFSLWSERNGRTPGKAMATLTAACADVQSGRMPHRNYLFMHPDAKPKPEEVTQFCDWTKQEIVHIAEMRKAPK